MLSLPAKKAFREKGLKGGLTELGTEIREERKAQGRASRLVKVPALGKVQYPSLSRSSELWVLYCTVLYLTPGLLKPTIARHGKRSK